MQTSPIATPSTSTPPRRSQSPPSWPEVLRCLGRDSVRSYAMGRFRDRGFSADSFGEGLCVAAMKTLSTTRGAREAMADTLTATEGWLEIEHPAYPERLAIRDVRRRLEWELWP